MDGTTGTVDQLWRDYKSTGDRELRNRLVMQYSPLVKFVAGRIRSGLPPTVDQADLVSDGVVGLMDAVDKFDPDRGLKFQTYAVSRIRGAIVDGLRAADWVPRSIREKIRDISAAQAKLENELGRAPHDREVASELGIALDELRRVYSETSYTSIVSFDSADQEDDLPSPVAAEMPGGDEDLPDGFIRAVRELPERDQVVVALYYWDRLTLAEIGQVLGVSESRVSQLHSRATMTLRRKLVAAG